MPGFDKPLPLFTVTLQDGTTECWRRRAASACRRRWSIRPSPRKPINVAINKREPLRETAFACRNYTEPLRQFDFLRYLGNSVFVTVVATLITLLINSMAAFALSIYEFPGRNAAMLAIIGTLMIPITVILVPVYLVVTSLGLVNSLWAVILPGAATPTGVFLLRQYMMTLPRDLIEAARMDKASEWQTASSAPAAASRTSCRPMRSTNRNDTASAPNRFRRSCATTSTDSPGGAASAAASSSPSSRSPLSTTTSIRLPQLLPRLSATSPERRVLPGQGGRRIAVRTSNCAFGPGAGLASPRVLNAS